MPLSDVDKEPARAFRDLHKLRRLHAGEDGERRLRRQPLLRTRVDVQALRDASAAGRELHQRIGDLVLARVGAGRGELADYVAGVVVGDDAGQQVALGVHKPHRVGVAVDEEVAAARDGRRYKFRNRRVGDDPHPYLRGGRIPSARDLRAGMVADLDQLARRGIAALHRAGEHPGMAM